MGSHEGKLNVRFRYTLKGYTKASPLIEQIACIFNFTITWPAPASQPARFDGISSLVTGLARLAGLKIYEIINPQN